MAETRKLAATLAADVVGYSRLTGSDEDRTLFPRGAFLRPSRRLQEKQ
jgi:class 3 adenylate cyclase